MSDVERTALGDTLAGQNQYKVFAAVLQNFDTAVEATATAYNSAGSAAKENERSIDSLEGHTNNLKAAFEDLSNNVIPNELIKSLLDLATGFLELANTGVGRFLIQFTLVSTTVLGSTTMFTQLAVKVLPLLKAAFVSAAGGALTLQAALGWVSIAAGALVALVGVLSTTRKETETVTQTAEDLSSELGNIQTKLKELSETPAADRTEEWYAEYLQLRENNAELEKRKKLLDKTQTTNKLEQARKSVYDQKTQYNVVGNASIFDYGRAIWDLIALGEPIDDWEEYSSHLIGVYDTLEEAQEAVKTWGGTIEKQMVSTGKQTVNLNKYLQDAIDLFDRSGEKTIENQTHVASLLKKYSNYYSALKEAQQAEEQGVLAKGTLTDKEREFISLFEQASTVYTRATESLETYGIKLEIVQKVAPDLAKYLNQAGWSINSLADYCNSAGISLDTLKDKMIAAAQAAMTLQTYEEIREKLGAAEFLKQYGRRGVQQLGKNKTVPYAGFSEIEQQIENAFSLIKLASSTRSSGTGNGTGDNNKTLTQAEKNLQEFRSQLAYLDHELAMNNISTEQYYSRLQQLMDAYLQDAENVETLWKYQEKIYKHSQEELQNYYQEQLDQQNALIDKINERFDAEIAGLEKSNDELEKQIEYEQLLEDMASAKAKKSLVFKNGAFQYVEDVDAISSAQNALRKYYRQQEVEQKKQNIEAARQRELQEPQQLVSRLEEIIKNIKGYATGTTYSAGGLSLVGEHGAELAVLSKGTGVIPADVTKNLWAWGQTTPSALMSTVAGVNGQNGGIYFSGVTMSFPSVRNGNDAQSFMQSVVNLAYQRAYSRK